MSGLIFNIQRFAIHDGPGIRTTIFMKGCPLSCWWCHNPEGICPSIELMWTRYKCIHCQSCVDICPNRALSFDEDRLMLDRTRCTSCGKCAQICPTTALKVVGKWVEEEDIFREIEKDMMYFDQSDGGVTFSGGEPLLQTDFLLQVLPKIKSHQIHVAIDTSGYTTKEDLEKILPYVDLFLYDLKMVDRAKHKENTGVENDIIKENLRSLISKKKHVIIRIPVIPGVNDSKSDTDEFIVFLKSLNDDIEVNLLPYHDVSEKYEALWKKTRNAITKDLDEAVLRIKNKLQMNGLKVKIGG
ncbi:MAG: glycyl-radical enzyme activating protein [Pseudothermotoga sp.]